MKSKKTILVFILTLGFLVTACSKKTVSIAGTWHLVSFGDASAPTLADPNTTTYIQIGENGNIDGNVGCNTFNLTYEISDNRINFGAINATKKVCRNMVVQESTVFSILSGNETLLELDENILQIHSLDGKSVLVLERSDKN